MKAVFALSAAVLSMLVMAAAPPTPAATPSAAATASAAPGAGSQAPVTVLKSVVGGKVEPYDLQAAAAKRPVVLYFFPKAFSAG